MLLDASSVAPSPNACVRASPSITTTPTTATAGVAPLRDDDSARDRAVLGPPVIPLFSAEGNAALEALRTLLDASTGSTSDGTLAPIVMRPEDAVASDHTVHLLSTLGALVPVAVITGRSVADARRHLEFTPLHLVGNHGAEGLPSPLHRSLANSLSASGGQSPPPRDRPGVAGAVAGGDRSPRPSSRASSSRTRPIRCRSTIGARSIAMPRATRWCRRSRSSSRHHSASAASSWSTCCPRARRTRASRSPSWSGFEECETAFYIGDDLTDERIFVTAPPALGHGPRRARAPTARRASISTSRSTSTHASTGWCGR